MDIPALRQHNQGIGRSFTSVADAVRGLGAIQAQDYPAALWAVALRCDGVTEVDVEDAIARGEIVRTWPMRGTYHFVAAEDARWMVGLLGPRVLAGVARRHRQLELEEADFKRSEDVCRRELTGGRRLTRPSFYRLLQSDGVSTAGQRGIHIVQYLALTGLICYGPREGSQPTLVLLDEWTPASKALDREEALAAIALRYFAGHGPATLRDFGWWTGLAANEARDAIALAGPALLDASIDGLRYWLTGERIATVQCEPAVLLPAFDEYLVGYTDRSAVLASERGRAVNNGGGLLNPVLVLDGRVRGTWKRELTKDAVGVKVTPFDPLSDAEKEQTASAAARYGRFLDLALQLTVIGA